MYIDLKWTNANSGMMKTNIYRSTTPLDKANLGTPVVVLTNNETTWRDLSVSPAVTYYYVIEFEANDVKVSTRVFTMTASYTRGHGNATVVLGDQEYGLMDQVAVGRMVSVLTSAGFSQSGMTDTTFGPGTKFSYKNKVYYVIMMQANLVGSTMAALTPLFNNNDGVPVTIEGFNYLLRLAKVLGPSWDGSTKVTTTTDLDEFYIKFVLPQFSFLANWPGESLGKLNNLAATNIIVGRDVVAGTVATRVGRNAAVTWSATTTSLTSSTYVPFILELVE
ncbi:hypothetical protein pEaSNUABM37_00110 [Erwinia phage pEa_SNUABM_37]|nr:hypothetical protein pEaSNUABM37_00110 [Erwinia phage pEa_SNUABM_37]QXO10580.1 hypothetical protein pEaSNUABM48_00110 [Erwinia phage pEa_SNUABM_48]